jgi:hypothetical protein
MRTAISKVKNNPLMAIAGGIATYYYINKEMPNSRIKNNPYYLGGVVILGAIATAYASSYVKSITKNPIGL